MSDTPGIAGTTMLPVSLQKAPTRCDVREVTGAAAAREDRVKLVTPRSVSGEETGAVVVGCEVLIRSTSGEQVITIVTPDQMGLWRLSERTALGRALIGRRVGDVVDVETEAHTVSFEVLAIMPPASTMGTDARVAESADAALLRSALLPAEGPGSSPGAGTTHNPGLSKRDDSDASTDRAVQVGDMVDVQDGDIREWWRVVPHVEADAARRCISDQSALGLALLGHRAGEVVKVRPPAVRGVRGPARLVIILAVKPAGTPA